MVGNLGTALAAFFADLGTLGSRVTLVTLTEFEPPVERERRAWT